MTWPLKLSDAHPDHDGVVVALSCFGARMIVKSKILPYLFMNDNFLEKDAAKLALTTPSPAG
ncbi:hypothetical protein KXS07_16855 [Inquilinus limosus]|uniref:hypothetical protein n=1 Tax=Inquilinus limosus TaxID=171674 RepID=UPI003F1754E0